MCVIQFKVLRVTVRLQGLWMWPDTNFHWCRHDTNKLWSHKPGQTPVKDEDNDGKPITDPAKVGSRTRCCRS